MRRAVTSRGIVGLVSGQEDGSRVVSHNKSSVISSIPEDSLFIALNCAYNTARHHGWRYVVYLQQ